MEIDLLKKTKGKNSPVIEYYENFDLNGSWYIIIEFCEVFFN